MAKRRMEAVVNQLRKYYKLLLPPLLEDIKDIQYALDIPPTGIFEIQEESVFLDVFDKTTQHLGHPATFLRFGFEASIGGDNAIAIGPCTHAVANSIAIGAEMETNKYELRINTDWMERVIRNV